MFCCKYYKKDMNSIKFFDIDLPGIDLQLIFGMSDDLVIPRQFPTLTLFPQVRNFLDIGYSFFKERFIEYQMKWFHKNTKFNKTVMGKRLA